MKQIPTFIQVHIFLYLKRYTFRCYSMNSLMRVFLANWGVYEIIVNLGYTLNLTITNMGKHNQLKAERWLMPLEM